MSDKSPEEIRAEEELILIQKILNGEVAPDLVQSYKIIKGSIDLAIAKGVYSAADNVLLVRAFDTLRNHINEYIASTTEKIHTNKPPRKKK